MRNLPLGAKPYLLLLFVVLLWQVSTSSAVAKTGITIGFAADSADVPVSTEQGREFGLFLENQLSIPVNVRRFNSEEQLYLWLTRFREVDIAWLSQDSLASFPAGQLYPLAKSQNNAAASFNGEIVARQGLQRGLLQQIETVLLSMHDISSGKVQLEKMGVSRLVSSAAKQGFESEGFAKAPAFIGSPLAAEQEGGFEATSAAVLKTQESPSQAPAFTESRQSELTPAADKRTGDAPVVMASEIRPSAEEPSSAQKKMAADSLSISDSGENSGESPQQIPQAGIDRKKQVALVADYLEYNSEEDSYEAKGDVILSQGEVELKSETLLWQSSTQDAAAQGSVSLRDTEAEVFGQRMQYNLATEQGQIRDGRIFVRQGNFHLIGEQIEKHSQTEYFVKQGSFTTCDGEIPDWKFSASEVDVTLGGYAKAKDVWFHIKDVPVLYTPYMSFPVRTERESGFLMPSFGYSNNKGTRASVAWYKVIDRHMDATIYLDYFSDIGLGKGLEYRYALPKQNNGRAFYQHVTGFDNTPDLYYVEWNHHGKLPGDWQLTADIEYANKQLFFEEFGETAEDYNRDKTVSRLMLRRNWQKLNLVGSARYIKDLEDDDFDPLQRLPELGLGLARYRLGSTPIYAGLESYATRFWRDDGDDGERLYLRPSVAAVFKFGAWLEIVPELAFYERIYNADSDEDEQFLPEYSVTLATRLVKDFDVNRWGIERIQHSVEPKGVYTYVPDDSQDVLPLFDLYDRIEHQNDISYALVNRLVARSKAADGSRVYRELLNLRLSQSYDIDEERNNRSGDNEPFSDLRVELGLRPTSNITMTLDGEIPVYSSVRFRTLRVGASVKDDVGNAVKVDYSYKDIDSSGLATDYVSAQVDTSLLKPLYVRLEERYDFRENHELEKVVALEYRSKCWSVFLSYRDRYREFEKDDKEVMISFVLSGLGMGKGFGTGF